MAIDHQKIIDGMTESKEYWDGKKEKGKLKPSQREEILGLKFKKGEEVKDNVTGKRGTIIAGSRAITGVQGTGNKGH